MSEKSSRSVGKFDSAAPLPPVAEHHAQTEHGEQHGGQYLDVGGQAIALIVAETVFIAVFILAGVLYLT